MLKTGLVIEDSFYSFGFQSDFLQCFGIIYNYV